MFGKWLGEEGRMNDRDRSLDVKKQCMSAKNGDKQPKSKFLARPQ